MDSARFARRELSSIGASIGGESFFLNFCPKRPCTPVHQLPYMVCVPNFLWASVEQSAPGSAIQIVGSASARAFPSIDLTDGKGRLEERH